jgi:hypothetical protein
MITSHTLSKRGLNDINFHVEWWKPINAELLSSFQIKTDAYGNSYTSANRYDANWTLLESTNSDSSGNNSVTQYQASADAATEVVSVIDKIELHNYVMKALGLTEDTITIDKFWTDAEVAEGRDASDRIIYNTTTDALYYNADGSVNTASIQIELMGLSTHPTMTYQDLLIV